MAVERWMPLALIGVILAGELTSMRKRPEAEKRDRGSYYVFRGTLVATYLVSFTLWGTGRLPSAGALGPIAPWIGAVLTVSGQSFRVWSMQTLGRYFTRTVHVSADQLIIETGPYRLLRHPSYTGAGLASLGVAVSLGHVLPILLIGGGFAIGAAYRIRVEERALLETLGEPYREYMKRTKRLIPHVF